MKTKLKSKSKNRLQAMDTEVGQPIVVPGTASPTTASESLIVPRSSIMPSPTNPRKTFPQGPLQELADSIRAQGIVQPIVVRRRPKVELHEPTLIQPKWEVLVKYPDGTFDHHYHDEEWDARAEYNDRTANGAEFEIIAGERRFRAAELAELKEVPVIVKNMTDQQVIEAQHVENLQREGVSPAEEAESYKKLIDSGIHTVESLAERLGVKRSTLYLRLKLTKLSPKVREAVDLGRLPYTVAELIGRIPGEKLQEQALKKVLTGEYVPASNGQHHQVSVSFRKAKELLEGQFVVDLKAAPFDTLAVYQGKIKGRQPIGDLPGDLTAVGPCDTCPRRSGNCKDEFPDVENPNVCTDPDCYAAKRVAHEYELKSKAETEGVRVLTGKEAQQCFSYNGQVNMGKGFASLDQCWPGTDKPIKKLIKDEAVAHTIAIVDGKAKKVYALADIETALSNAKAFKGNVKPIAEIQQESQQNTDDWRQRQAEREERSAKTRKLSEQVWPMFVEKVEKKMTAGALVRFLFEANVLDWPDPQISVKKMQQWLAKAKEQELLVTAYTAVMRRRVVGYEGGWHEDFVKQCEQYGIELDEITNELNLGDGAEANPENSADSKSAKAKKKGGKK
jgi:ParB/RepB/Spo0J family partition protein